MRNMRNITGNGEAFYPSAADIAAWEERLFCFICDADWSAFVEETQSSVKVGYKRADGGYDELELGEGDFYITSPVRKRIVKDLEAMIAST